MSRILVVLYVVAFVSSGVSIALVIFHFGRMIQEIRGRQYTKAALVGPFFLFMPGLFTDKGNYHRFRFFIYLSLAAVSMGLTAGISNYLNGIAK